MEPRELPSGTPGGESRLQKFLENSRKVPADTASV